MVRRVTPAQYEAIRRQEIARYNQEVRRHNQEVERQVRARQQAIDNYNREVRRYNQEVERAVSKYNQAVRDHNSQVRSNRQELQRRINALRNQPIQVRYTTITASTYALHENYERIEKQRHISDFHDQIITLSERESSNSLAVMDALLGDEAGNKTDPVQPEDTIVVECLRGLSEDLCARWRGAVYALNPMNPDAARHFCTSVREVLTEILEITARDSDVLSAIPNCPLTQQGKPTRRSKIMYLLQCKNVSSKELGDFVEADINNVIDLFGVFNEATHGPAGKHTFNKLQAIKKRVEGGVMFLTTLAI